MFDPSGIGMPRPMNNVRECRRNGFSLGCVAMFLLAVATAAQPVPDSLNPWRFTTSDPGGGWYLPDFDVSVWREGAGGFGSVGTPGARVFTEWETDEIWLRRIVEVTQVPNKPALFIHHDEDAEVYLNGALVVAVEGYTSEYVEILLESEAAEHIVAGANLVAVHCRQTGGGQFIDVHVTEHGRVPQLPQPPRPTTPALSSLITPWGVGVGSANAWTEYPRPQLRRNPVAFAATGSWTNLNGSWDYAITTTAERPQEWDGKIVVPFAVEAKLSGVQRLLQPEQTLWYRRRFNAAKPPDADRLLLHFEAVDYEAAVWISDTFVGEHKGGNVPFSFDITDAVVPGANEILVRVRDQTGGSQLRGKQVLDPRGIWYTRVSGIWQTVWLEQVPPVSIESLKVVADVKAGAVDVSVAIHSPGDAPADLGIVVVARDEDIVVATVEAATLSTNVIIPDARLWSPDSPHLYDLDVRLVDAHGEILDQVASYAGLREVGSARDAEGHLRFTLNGKEIFHWGPLDQGWWPDGLLTPPSDEAMAFELQYLKDAGFNMVRKHIKVEPRRYYYHADRLGIMVWQDHVSGGEGPPWSRFREGPIDAQWSDKDHAQFMSELEAMIAALEFFPSIVVWVPFNEAWGQHRTTAVAAWIRNRDPTRLVNAASGGNFWPVGDIADWHEYPHPDFPFEDGRFDDFIKVVGEFGGHGWPVEGHLWNASKRNWGYGGLPKSVDEYRERFEESIRILKDLKARGIAAGVYTQTTDVEGEINGLMTYDRKVMKLAPAALAEITQGLIE